MARLLSLEASFLHEIGYSLAGHFATPHAARATRQTDPPNESDLIAVNFYRMGLLGNENHV